MVIYIVFFFNCFALLTFSCLELFWKLCFSPDKLIAIDSMGCIGWLMGILFVRSWKTGLIMLIYIFIEDRHVGFYVFVVL